MNKIFYILLFVFIVGCSAPPLPPVFHRGDKVMVKKSNMIGIVRQIQSSGGKWYYCVMFAECDIEYVEDSLQMHSPATWTAPDAEIQSLDVELP